MAYLATNLTPEEEQKQLENPERTLSSGGGLLGGSSNRGVSGAPVSAAPSSSGFTDLRKYLNANQPQAVDYANKIAGNIESAGQQAKNTIETSLADYGKNYSGIAEPDYNLISQASQNPVEFVKNQQNLDAFKKMKSANVNDVGTFENISNYSDIYNKAKQAEDLAKLTQTESGRSELINQQSPNLGRGKTALNQLLIGANPNAQQVLTQKSQPYSNLISYLNSQSTSANDQRQKALENAQKSKELVQQEFVNKQLPNVQSIQSNLQNTLAQKTAQQNQTNAQIENLKKYLSGQGQLTPEEQAAFGISPTNEYNTLLNQSKQALISTNPGYYNGPGAYTVNSTSQGLLDLLLGKAVDPSRVDYLSNNAGLAPARNQINSLINSPQSPSTYIQKNPNAVSLNNFPGIYENTQNPTLASVSDPAQVAQILALQQLLEGDIAPIFSQEDLQQAGTFKPSTIGTYRA